MTDIVIAINAVKHLLNKGVPRPIAVGTVGVLAAGESGLLAGSHGKQPTEHGGVLNPDGSFGIACWNGPRQTTLKDFAALKGEPVDSVNTQLDFVLTEMANSYPTLWADYQATVNGGKMSIEQWITLFVRQYEVPKEPAPEIERSLKFALELDKAVGAAEAGSAAEAVGAAPEPAPVYTTPPSVVVSTTQTTGDHELNIITAMWNMLDSLDEPIAIRIVNYLTARVAEGKTK